MFPNYYQAFLDREILSERYLKISFSENAEDDFIRSYFWDKIISNDRGSYLDIGCYHDTAFSNTKLLSLVGWNGIAVDANPDLSNDWLRSRPNDYFINTCISPSGSRKKELDFYRFQAGAVSTSNQERAKQIISAGYALKDKIRIPSQTLPNLANSLKETKYFPFDFISIDLEYIDFWPDIPEFLTILKPRLVCIEVVGIDLNLGNYNQTPEVRLINQSSYEALAIYGQNIIAAPN